MTKNKIIIYSFLYILMATVDSVVCMESQNNIIAIRESYNNTCNSLSAFVYKNNNTNATEIAIQLYNQRKNRPYA